MKKQKVREFVIADKLGEKERIQRCVVLFMQNRHSFMGLQGSKYFCRRHTCENLREHFFSFAAEEKQFRKTCVNALAYLVSLHCSLLMGKCRSQCC